MDDTPWSIVGHSWAVRLLQRALETGRQAHAYLFTGPAHVGRCTLALALARALNCTASPSPCRLPLHASAARAARDSGACRACQLIAAGVHPDVRLVQAEGASIKIDQVRALQHELALSPVEARFRVAIIDGMQQATPEAANALLKTLEEPARYVVLILIAPEPDVLLPTIVSRCQHLALRPLAPDLLSQALVSGWGVAADRAEHLAHLSAGRLGWALRAAQDESVLQARTACLDDWLSLAGQGCVARFAYAERLADDGAAILETLECWETWWRDVLLVAAGSRAGLVNVERLEVLKQHAERFGVERARQALAALSSTSWQIAHNANARLALEVLMLDLPRQ